MKTFKLLCLFALVLTLAAGCAKPGTDDALKDDDCKVTDVAPSTETVPSYTDSVVTEPVEAVAAPTLGTIYFEFDQYTLSAEARDTLAENMRYLEANPSTTLVIEGHCDERGSDEYNLALGERRAVAAQEYLLSMGVTADRLSTISYGEEKPVDMAGTEAAWAKNRRAEFVPKP
nr:peptidoglycan-associated lipoprotein Pal [uncultured Desulfuromonas sp.]